MAYSNEVSYIGGGFNASLSINVKDTDILVFSVFNRLEPDELKQMEEELTSKIGVKCVIIYGNLMMHRIINKE